MDKEQKKLKQTWYYKDYTDRGYSYLSKLKRELYGTVFFHETC